MLLAYTVLAVFSLTNALVEYPTGSTVYDHIDLSPGQTKTVRCDIPTGCPMFASITGDSAYEQDIVIIPQLNQLPAFTLVELAVGSTAADGLKTPKMFNTSCTIINQNTVAQDRPFYIYVVHQYDATKYPMIEMLPVYEAAATSISSATKGVTLMSASSKLTLSKFHVDQNSDVSLYVGGYDNARYSQVLLSAIGSDNAAKSMCLINSPIMTIVSNGTKIGLSLSATIDNSLLAFDAGASLCGASAGYSSTAEPFRTSVKSQPTVSFTTSELVNVDATLFVYGTYADSITMTDDNNKTVLTGSSDTANPSQSKPFHLASKTLRLEMNLQSSNQTTSWFSIATQSNGALSQYGIVGTILLLVVSRLL